MLGICLKGEQGIGLLDSCDFRQSIRDRPVRLIMCLTRTTAIKSYPPPTE
jgi:hypothetical protein